MKSINLNNRKVKKVLDYYVDVLYDFTDEELEKYSKHFRCNDPFADQSLHATSDEYLYKIMRNRDPWVYAFPQDYYGLPFTEPSELPRFKKGMINNAKFDKLNAKMMRMLGLKRNAFCTVYPKTGFIGWHHNCNAPGLNVLFTYNKSGAGYFKYRDKNSGNIVTMPDQEGWSVKVGYYPGHSTLIDRGRTKTNELFKQNSNDFSVEPYEDNIENLFWHAAYAEDRRMTIAFILPNVDMWSATRELLEAE